MILTKQGRRYYYCYPCLTDEETRVKELKGHVFEPRQELRLAHLTSVRLLAGTFTSGFFMGLGLPHNMATSFPRQRAREMLYYFF